MKKTLKFITLLAIMVLLVVTLTGCTSDNTGSSVETNGGTTKQESKKEAPTIKVGETWVVDGQWKLTINSVKTTKTRNEFSDTNPEQVVYVTYTYENIGYKDSNGMMDGLYFDLTSGQIVDGSGEMGYSYPNDITNYPKETPVGAKCVNAQCCIGLNNKSKQFTINFSTYDGNSNRQEAKFILDID